MRIPLSSQHRIARTPSELGEMVRFMRDCPTRWVDAETDGDFPEGGSRVIGVSLAGAPTDNARANPLWVATIRAWYVPVGHVTGEPQADPSAARLAFGDALEGAQRIGGHNHPFDRKFFAFDRWPLPRQVPCVDTMNQAYLIDHNRRMQLEMLIDELGISPYAGGALKLKAKHDEFTKGRAKAKGMPWQESKTRPAYLPTYGHSEVPITFEGEYSCRDVVHACLLDAANGEEARGRNDPLYAVQRAALYANDMKLVRVLSDMEIRGTALDAEHLYALGRDMDREVMRLDEELRREFKFSMDFGNPGQLQDLLYRHFRLPVRVKTDSGAPAVDRTAIIFAGRDRPDLKPGLDLLAQRSECATVRSTYTDSLAKRVINGRVHTSFKSARVKSGRLSSAKPNLQNIPIRTELGKRIRQAFVVPPGKSRVMSDYSQVELRLLAWITGSPVFTGAYQSPAYDALLRGECSYEQYRIARRREEKVDVHGNVTRETFGIRDDHPEWKVKRRAAKVLNFAIPYGGAEGVLTTNPELMLPEDQAEEIYARYQRANRHIDDAKGRVLSRARANEGLLVNWAGFRLHVPGIFHRDRETRSSAERTLFASLVQGSAGMLTRYSLVWIQELMDRGELPGELVLTVHDDIQVDVDTQDERRCALGVQGAMENFTGLFGPIPIVADLEVSRESWAVKEAYDPYAVRPPVPAVMKGATV